MTHREEMTPASAMTEHDEEHACETVLKAPGKQSTLDKCHKRGLALTTDR